MRFGAQALKVYAMVFNDPVTMARDSADSERISLAHANKMAPMGVTVKLRKKPANLAELAAGQIDNWRSVFDYLFQLCTYDDIPGQWGYSAK
jgi:hypothetical protein